MLLTNIFYVKVVNFFTQAHKIQNTVYKQLPGVTNKNIIVTAGFDVQSS